MANPLIVESIEEPRIEQARGEPLSVRAAIDRALSGRLGLGERAWAWRLLLKVVPASTRPEEMEAAMVAKREEYFDLRKEHLPDIATVAQSDDGDPLSNMLFSSDSGTASSGGKKSRWDKYHESVDLREEIRKDLERLTISGLEENHFSPVLENMLSVLAVWASSRGGSTGYRQGMHEVLAIVFLVIQDEAFYGGGLEPSIEADAFSLFDAIMAQHKPLFAIADDTENDTSLGSRKKRQRRSPVLALLRRAQITLLAKIDPGFAAIVSSLEAQLYGLRWTRLLFLREFKRSPAEPLALCDGIFAMVADAKVSHLLDALECAFVGLVLANKRRILAELEDGGDKQMACLAILMRPQDVAASHVMSLATGPVLRALQSRRSTLSPTESGFYSEDEEDEQPVQASALDLPPTAGDPLQGTMPLFTQSSTLPPHRTSPSPNPSSSSYADPLLNPVVANHSAPLAPALDPLLGHSNMSHSSQPQPQPTLSPATVRPSPNRRPSEVSSPEKLATTLNSALLVLDQAVPYTNLSARRAIEEIADVAATLQKLQHSATESISSQNSAPQQQHPLQQVAV